ncbi:MAG TPA: SDR family NAD(P)-dependent oxidoreductase [Candidatus Binatia bacterium]|nr:SDR family NAD(P)-dependent oxidoreductase [Candidatus Binatia bacterium]
MRDTQRVVLITGGSGGLGRALARSFARNGSPVVITSRNKSRLEAVAAEINREGGHALALSCDVGQKDAVERLASDVENQVGSVEVLINNAGIAPAVSFLEMPDSVWHEVLNINLSGTYNCCKTFLPAMIRSRWGRIINIASTTAKVAYSHVSAYTSSKHGVLGLTRSLALESAKAGVTVNAICPGYLDTQLTHKSAVLMAQKTGKTVAEVINIFAGTSPQNRLIAPEEVASLALLLASDKAAAITGQAINVDGGAVMV